MGVGNKIFDCYKGVTKTIAKELIDIITLHSKDIASPFPPLTFKAL